MTRVLILRPEPGASATAAHVRALGLDPIVQPLFEIVARDWAAPDPGDVEAVMLTSANAARMAGAQLARFNHLPAFVVGKRTAAAARDAGFADIDIGEGDAQSIIDRLAGAGVTRALHLCGEDRTPIDVGAMVLTQMTVYAAEAIDPAPALEAADIVLLHSSRAARRFAALWPDRTTVAVAAISAAVLAAAGAGWRATAVAAMPCDDALLAAAARLCQ